VEEGQADIAETPTTAQEVVPTPIRVQDPNSSPGRNSH